uniref:CHHC U11-48K-type domain-containing protein n=1 Tax=Chelonoidis abingdonii TaxID=106734 RepID=A0A8C0IRJ5_CHEAB
EKETYTDALDPGKLIQCPYDCYHQIRACRFPYHLIKCRKNHPDIAEQLATHPFNAHHQVPRAEIRHHISTCDDKSCIEQDIDEKILDSFEKMNTVSMWQTSPCDEDWDKGEELVMEPKNNLMPGMRAPRSLPYSLFWKSSKCKGRWSPHSVSWGLVYMLARSGTG